MNELAGHYLNQIKGRPDRMAENCTPVAAAIAAMTAAARGKMAPGHFSADIRAGKAHNRVDEDADGDRIRREA
jgi:hypothetical protein